MDPPPKGTYELDTNFQWLGPLQLRDSIFDAQQPDRIYCHLQHYQYLMNFCWKLAFSSSFQQKKASMVENAFPTLLT